MRNEIRKSLNRMAQWEKLANQADDALELDPFNEDLEKASDHYYELAFNEYVHCVHLVTRFSGIDEHSAKIIVNEKRNELRALIA